MEMLKTNMMITPGIKKCKFFFKNWRNLWSSAKIFEKTQGFSEKLKNYAGKRKLHAKKHVCLPPPPDPARVENGCGDSL